MQCKTHLAIWNLPSIGLRHLNSLCFLRNMLSTNLNTPSSQNTGMAFWSKCSASATNFFIAVYTLYGSVTGFGMKGKKPTCTLGTHDSHTCPSLKIFKYYRQWSCISDATNDELNKLLFVGLLVIDFWSFTKSSDSTVKVSGISRDFCILNS